MKLLRVGDPGQERPAVRDENGVARDLTGLTGDFGPGFFARGGLAELAAALADPAATAALPAVDGRIGAPIARPGKIVCIGLNYRDHAAETGAAIPERPVVFMKDPSTVAGPYDDVRIPRGSERTDWEVELGVVIGATARYLGSPDDGAGLRRRLRRQPRRVGTGVPARPVAAVGPRQVVRDVQPARAVAGHRGRGARPADARAATGGQRAQAAGWVDGAT